MNGTVDSREKFQLASHEHNGTIFRVTLRSIMVQFTSVMCLIILWSAIRGTGEKSIRVGLELISFPHSMHYSTPLPIAFSSRKALGTRLDSLTRAFSSRLRFFATIVAFIMIDCCHVVHVTSFTLPDPV